jgi:transcriptional regulator with XRE-family HTH domain
MSDRRTAPHLDLLGQVLKAAAAQGLDQARLAERAGLAPATLSRAKKRGDMELGTLKALCEVVGLELRLAPAMTKPPAQAPSALAQPRFALAWSNPGAGRDVLMRKALLEGRTEALVAAALESGLPRLQAELQALRRRGGLDESRHAQLQHLLASIEKGMRDADAA